MQNWWYSIQWIKVIRYGGWELHEWNECAKLPNWSYSAASGERTNRSNGSTEKVLSDKVFSMWSVNYNLNVLFLDHNKPFQHNISITTSLVFFLNKPLMNFENKFLLNQKNWKNKNPVLFFHDVQIQLDLAKRNIFMLHDLVKP